MRLDQMVTNALQLSSIVNGMLISENQNQGKELGEVPDLESRFEIDLLSEETQPDKKRHAKHRIELDTHQYSKPLDEMSDDDPNHPYAAHRPKKMHVKPSHYRNNFKQSQSMHKEISDSIERTKETFYSLKERYIAEYDMERKYTHTNLQDAQSLYKDFRHLKDRLLENQSFMEEQREAIHVFLEEDPAPNRNKHLREYFKMYNNEINDSKMDQLRINSLMADCERMVNELQEATKSKVPYLANSSKTKSPTISPQEEGLLRRNKELSTDFNRLTQAINHLRGQANELQERLFWNKQFPGEKLPYNRHDMEADLDHIINDQLPKLEGERTFVQDEIIKEKNYIDSLVKDGKINASKAEAYINEYNEVINNFEESMNHFDNQRNKRERVENPSLSENTLTTATTPASPTPAINATPEQPTLAKTTTTESPTLSIPETYIQRRNKMLELKFDMVMQETKALNEQFLEIDNFFLSKKKAHDFTLSKTNEDLSLRQDNIKDKLLPKLKNETNLLQDQIMNEKNYINSLVKTGEMSSLKAEEDMNEYDKLTNQFEKLSNQFDVDNRRNITDKLLKQHFPNFTPTTVMNNTFTTKRPTISTPETYIRRRNKMLASDFSKVMEEISDLRNHVNGLITEIDLNVSLKKVYPELYKRLPSDEDLNAKIDDAKNNQLPKLAYERDLVQSQIMNEKNYISSLVKEGKISAVEAEEFINRYNGLMDKYKQPIPDINMDNITTTTERTATTTTEIPTLSTSETYIGRRNKILELNFDMVIQETMYLSNKANEIEDMLFLKEQFPDLPLPNSIETLKAQRDEIRGELLPTLVDQRDFVQYQIMNEKDSIEPLVKEGKMSAVEAEKYRNEYNKLIDKFEVPVNVFGHEFDNIRKKRDLSLEQSFSEKSVNIATDNKEKPRLSDKSANKATDKKEKQRLSKKLESITTNNKQNVLRGRSVMKREPVIAR